MSYSVSLSQRDFIYPRSRERLVYSSKNKKLIAYFLILLIILFSVLYIVQANNVATWGFRIQKYQSELSGLQSENKSLGLNLSEAQSLEFLEEKIGSLNMVKVGKVEYLSPVSEVAVK